jgi:hypothetical protein
MNRRLAVLLPTIAIAAAVACGSSSSGNGNTGTQNEGDASSSSGSSGSSGSGESGTTTGEGDAGTSSSAPVVCGGTTCSAPSGVIMLSSCCQADNTCGATFSAGGLGGLGGAAGGGALPADAGLPCLDTSAGTADSTCPSQTAMGFSLAGCCTKGGVCGSDLSMIGLGCNSISALFAGLGGTPQACGAGADGSAPVSDAAPMSDAKPE